MQGANFFNVFIWFEFLNISFALGYGTMNWSAIIAVTHAQTKKTITNKHGIIKTSKVILLYKCKSLKLR